jgi:hypothetical protein
MKLKGAEIKNYISARYVDLLNMLLISTQNVNFEDEDDDSDEWGVALSAVCCLDKVA